jgi:hypothetical protein
MSFDEFHWENPFKFSNIINNVLNASLNDTYYIKQKPNIFLTTLREIVDQ